MQGLTSNPFNLFRGVLHAISNCRLHANTSVHRLGVDGYRQCCTNSALMMLYCTLAQEVGSGETPEWTASTEDIAPFFADLSMFISTGPNALGWQTKFFRRTACVIAMAERQLNEVGNPHRHDAALALLNKLDESLLKRACCLWINILKGKNAATTSGT